MTFETGCVNPEQIAIRINTDGDYAWRLDLYDRTADRLGENTRTRTIDESCEFTLAMLDNLEEAIEHPDMTEELAEVLSTDTARLTYEVNAEINIGAE